MEVYCGSWKFVECTNFDEYLKGLGIPAPLRMLAGITSPTITIKQEGQGGYKKYDLWGIRNCQNIQGGDLLFTTGMQLS